MGWFYVFVLIPNPEVDVEAVEKIMDTESCCVERDWEAQQHRKTQETIYKCIKNKDGIYAVLCGGGEKVYSFGQDKTYADGTPIRYAEIPVMDSYDWDRWSKQNQVLKLTKREMVTEETLSKGWPKMHGLLNAHLRDGIKAFWLSTSKINFPPEFREACVQKIILLWNMPPPTDKKVIKEDDKSSTATKDTKDKDRRRTRSRERRRNSPSRSRSRSRRSRSPRGRSRSRSNSRTRRRGGSYRRGSPTKRRKSPDTRKRKNTRSGSKDRSRRRSKERRRSPVPKRRHSGSRERNKKRKRSRSRERRHR